MGRSCRERKRNGWLTSSDESSPAKKIKPSSKAKTKEKQKDALTNAKNQCKSDLKNFTIPDCRFFRIPSPIQSDVLEAQDASVSACAAKGAVTKNLIPSQQVSGFAQSTQKRCDSKKNNVLRDIINNISHIHHDSHHHPPKTQVSRIATGNHAMRNMANASQIRHPPKIDRPKVHVTQGSKVTDRSYNNAAHIRHPPKSEQPKHSANQKAIDAINPELKVVLIRIEGKQFSSLQNPILTWLNK